MIGWEAPRSNREGGMARTGAPGSVTGKGPPWRGLGLRDTAPALQSITKHNHIARAGDEDSFDLEQRIQGQKGVASQTWTEAQRAVWPRLHTGLHAPLLPTSNLCPGVELYQKFPGWRTKLLDGSAEDLRHTQHTSMGCLTPSGKATVPLRAHPHAAWPADLLGGGGQPVPSQAHRDLKQSRSHMGWGPKGSPGRVCVGCLGSGLNVAALPA